MNFQIQPNQDQEVKILNTTLCIITFRLSLKYLRRDFSFHDILSFNISKLSITHQVLNLVDVNKDNSITFEDIEGLNDKDWESLNKMFAPTYDEGGRAILSECFF